jgi:4-oxalocrotonate tautomerase
MPVVHIYMLEGKTTDQKRAMVREVTEALCRTLDVTANSVIIQLVELEGSNVGAGGKLALDR